MILGDTKRIITRKERPCHWCGEAIEVGQPAIRWAWLDMRRVSTVRTHIECYDAWTVSGFDECMFGEHKRPEASDG